MRSIVAVIICSLILAGSVGAEDYATLNNDGNQAFAEKNYKDALDLYRQAEVERPETPEIYYNQANALVESQNFTEAVKKFAKALYTDDMDLQSVTYYNGGNGFFQQDSFKTAIEWYQKALELNPDDIDTKYNLELARNRLKEQMERQSKDQDQKEDQEQEQKEQEDQEEQGEPDPNKDEEQQQQPPPRDDGEEKDEDARENEEQPTNPDEMSKEDAERVLDALENNEKKNQKNVKRFKIKGTYVGNDW